jgi:hypothetical protein
MDESERATQSGGESAPVAGKSGKGKAVIKRRKETPPPDQTAQGAGREGQDPQTYREGSCLTPPRDPQVVAKIQERAYVLFRAGGCQHGHDLEHWLEAERQIIGGSDQPTR